jgi:hypothetical protein
MKLLILAACFVPSMDGPQFLDANTFAEMDEDTGRATVQAGKALYVDPKDDKTRTKTFTAPSERVQAVSQALKDAAKAAAKAPA